LIALGSIDCVGAAGQVGVWGTDAAARRKKKSTRPARPRPASRDSDHSCGPGSGHNDVQRRASRTAGSVRAFFFVVGCAGGVIPGHSSMKHH
jgi:DsbC/DsbD-like thiol-disulfide interchange protein